MKKPEALKRCPVVRDLNDDELKKVFGLIPGIAAVYGAAAVILQDKYGRWVLPIGLKQ